MLYFFKGAYLHTLFIILMCGKFIYFFHLLLLLFLAIYLNLFVPNQDAGNVAIILRTLLLALGNHLISSLCGCKDRALQCLFL